MQWEYKTIYGFTDNELNELGAEGWELVSAHPETGDMGSTFYSMAALKRPIKAAEEAEK
jgi:hypothetical protein